MQNSDPSLIAAMQRACTEARRWLGATFPNPPVGAAALDDAGNILAVAAHRRAGEDHAEAALLKLCARQNLQQKVHTVVVTLEPCNHTGRTPPCCEALIDADVRRVVVGMRDPNPDVKGGGCERLRAAGIDIVEGVEADACQRLVHAFAFRAKTGRPFVTVKRAFDADGSMIPPKGRKTFTSRDSLILAHRLRKKADAIVTGSGTIGADAPLFSVRYVQDHVGKKRILAILDRRGRVPQDYLRQANERGFEAIVYKDMDACFADLASRGAQDVLVEAGPLLSTSILDSCHWTMAVDIHAPRQNAKDVKDTINVRFNEKESLPFHVTDDDIEAFLPL